MTSIIIHFYSSQSSTYLVQLWIPNFDKSHSTLSIHRNHGISPKLSPSFFSVVIVYTFLQFSIRPICRIHSSLNIFMKDFILSSFNKSLDSILYLLEYTDKDVRTLSHFDVRTWEGSRLEDLGHSTYIASFKRAL